MLSDIDEVMGKIGEQLKELNLQASALNAIDSPMFQDSIIGLKLNDSDFETSAQTWINFKDNRFFHDDVIKAVKDVIDKSA